MPKTLLITGATGRQGSSVLSALLAHDPTGTQFHLLCLTRNAASPSALRLLALNAPHLQLVQGDLNNVPALFEEALRLNANKPIWGLYSVQSSLGPGVTTEGEIKQGKALVDAAVEHGVKFFVYSSVERGGDTASWEEETPIPHFQTKLVIERYLRDVTKGKGQEMGWTILRPVAFMDNLEPGFKTSVFIAALWNHLGESEKKMQWVATADIGVFAAKAFDKPEEWNGRAVGIAGDELTMDDLNRAFERATGKPAPVAWWGFGSLLTTMVKELGLMIGWFADGGYRADVEARRRDYEGLMTMEDWLKSEGSTFTTTK